MSKQQRTFGAISLPELSSILKSSSVNLDYGACRVKVKAGGTRFEESLKAVYRSFRFIEDEPFSDFHVRLHPGSLARRLFRPAVHFAIDGVHPFDPFPLSDALPMYEWGINWCFAQRFNQYVLLHAGTLAVGGRAVIMAATPGSGKSTLTAALMLRGFRLLSDEFGVLDPDTGQLLPMLKPVALKNQSIDVIRSFSDDAWLGPIFKATRKGDVAHLAPDEASVSQVRQPAKPALVIFPRYEAGAELSLRPQAPEQTFTRLAFNSFNYALLGPVSFTAVADVAADCPAYELRYSRLEDAVRCVHKLLLDSSSSDA
ncbi:MAG: HprK-related kinase A [Propionivibrio sp.]